MWKSHIGRGGSTWRKAQRSRPLEEQWVLQPLMSEEDGYFDNDADKPKPHEFVFSVLEHDFGGSSLNGNVIPKFDGKAGVKGRARC